MFEMHKFISVYSLILLLLLLYAVISISVLQRHKVPCKLYLTHPLVSVQRIDQCRPNHRNYALQKAVVFLLADHAGQMAETL